MYLSAAKKIGTKGFVCINKCGDCTTVSHKTKVEIRPPTFFVMYAPMRDTNRVFLSPTLVVDIISRIAVDSILL